MKNSLVCAGAVALLLSVSCSRQESAQSGAPASPSQDELAARIMAEVKAKTNVAASVPVATPVPAVTEAAPAAPAAAPAPVQPAAPVEAITTKAQALIDSVSRLLAENKWQEALKTLGELSSLKLTPEQQKTVDALNAQAQSLAQRAATDKAAKSVTDLLKKP